MATMLDCSPFHGEIPPDQCGLILALAPRLTQQLRHSIAMCDYGDDVEGHRAAIDGILRTGRVDGVLDWVPREVLALTRWSTIQPTHGRDVAESIHLQRLFACAALMQPLAFDPLDEDASEATLAGFIDSAIALKHQAGALGLLSWILERLRSFLQAAAETARSSGDEVFHPSDGLSMDTAFLMLAVVLIDRSQGVPRLSSETVEEAVRLTEEIDRGQRGEGDGKHTFVLFNFGFKSQRHDLWCRLLSEALGRETARDAEGRQDLAESAYGSLQQLLERALATPPGEALPGQRAD